MYIDEIKHLLPKDCSWCDVLSVDGSSSSVKFSNNRFHSASEKQSGGLGVRINAGGRTGFSFTNSRENITSAAKTAVSLVPYGDAENFTLPNTPCEVTREPEKINAFSVEEEIKKGGEIISLIRGAYEEANISVNLGASSVLTGLVNSEGFAGKYDSSFYSLSVSASLMKNGSKIEVWDSLSAVSPCSAAHIPKRIIALIRLSEKERKAGSGILPFVFTPKAFANLIDIVIAGLEGRAVYKGLSHYTGKIGENFFAPSLTIIDDPTITGSPYSYPFDDEGVTGAKKYLIQEGRIASLIAGLKYASLLGIEPSGNASRGYSSLPSASFSSICVDAGETEIAQILKTFRRGIIADQFIGLGQSNTVNGDFSANLDMAWLFENGEITGRVKDCMIAGNIFTLLKNEFMLSSEREQRGSTLAPYAGFPAVHFTASP
jgi:PmbA protein